MQLNDALARYAIQLVADGRSPHTIHQYGRHIGLLDSWLREHGSGAEVEEIDHETLACFLSSSAARQRPDGRAKCATSANAMRTSLRTFFRYAHEAGYVRSNPARLVRRALCSPPPPQSLSDEEAGRLLNVIAGGHDPAARRDCALFGLMLGSGIRLGSALGLDVADVDLHRSELRLRRSKNDAPGVLPLSRGVCELLRRFIAGRKSGPLFRGRGGRTLSPRHVQRRLAHWCNLAMIERRVRPHDLRHSFAMRLYRRTRDLLLVQQALRHRSITSTTVYAQCDDARLREVLSPATQEGTVS